jgi:enoyl-CoA hydratase
VNSDLVLCTDDDSLSVITLNKPDKLNALDSEMFRQLLRHIERLEQLPDQIGCVVIRGSGKCFSAGHDLNAIQTGESSADHILQSKVVERLANLPQAVISAVHGHCYTGALELALAGDLILASQSARFADTHAKWALTPIWGMSQRLPRRVGVAKAREMMFTCKVYDGAAAESMGLANACFPDESFFDEVEKLAKTILANSSFSISALKRLLIETDGMPLSAGIAHEVFRGAGVGPDIDARIARFSRRKDQHA